MSQSMQQSEHTSKQNSSGKTKQKKSQLDHAEMRRGYANMLERNSQPAQMMAEEEMQMKVEDKDVVKDKSGDRGTPGCNINNKGNDYFTMDGFYVGSDNKGNEVRILTGDGNTKGSYAHRTGIIPTAADYTFYSKNFILLPEISLSEEAVLRIFSTYYPGNPKDLQIDRTVIIMASGSRILGKQKLGNGKFKYITDKKSGISKKDGSYYTQNKHAIMIGMDKNGRVHEFFFDKYSIISSIVHEKSHIDDVEPSKEKEGYNYKAYTTDINEGDDAIVRHLMGAYADQVADKSFKKTDIDYRRKFHQYYLDYWNAIKNNDKKNMVDAYYYDKLGYRTPEGFN